MPVKLTGSVVGRLDGVHDDNNKRSSLSLSSPTLSLSLSLSRCPPPFSLRPLSFSSSFLLPLSLSARARRPLWSLASFVHLNTAFRVALPTRIPGENPVISKKERERGTSTRRKKRVEGERERRSGDLRDVKWVSRLQTSPPYTPPLYFFTDHLSQLVLFLLRHGHPFPDFSFFFFFFFFLCHSLLSHCAPRTHRQPSKNILLLLLLLEKDNSSRFNAP